MSKHICPRCGFKFEDSDYSNYGEYIPIENNNWSYFDVTDGSFSAICDICHKKFHKGYIKGCKPERSINGDVYISSCRQQCVCSECAKKWNYAF